MHYRRNPSILVSKSSVVFHCRLLADVVVAGSRLAPGVGDAGGTSEQLGQALALRAERAVLVVRTVRVPDALDTFIPDSAPSRSALAIR